MIGIDVADIERAEKLLKYNPTFLDKVFCAEEKDYLALRGNNPETIAEWISLKEAALKAAGAVSLKDGYSLVEIKISSEGRAELSFKGELSDRQVSASVFHTEHNAVAVAEADDEAKNESNPRF